MSDKVHITGLQGLAIVGLDHWKKPVPHPVSINVTFHTDFSRASETDNLHYSLNYAVISDKIASHLQQNHHKNFNSLGGVASSVYEVLRAERTHCSDVELEVSAPKVDIRALVSYSTRKSGGVYKIAGLRALTLIGVFTFERLNKQFVCLDMDLHVSLDHLNVGRVSELVQDYLESANFKTVEALVSLTSQWILQNFPEISGAGVRVTKPNAIVYTEGVGVSCYHTRADFASLPPIVLQKSEANDAFDLPVEALHDFQGSHLVYVALGSNEGDQMANIQTALHLLEQHPQISVDCTSSLYVSKPMYHTDQADFFNGVVRLSVTDLTPHELLKVLRKIEYTDLNRVKAFENGPRSIDLDLILYGRATVTSEDLIVPHKAMLERTFVLEPLCELLSPDFTHPVTAEPIHNHLTKLLGAPTSVEIQKSAKLILVFPGMHGRKLMLNHDGSSPTILMAIFNATPDSFSDGGTKYELTDDEVIQAAREMKKQGARIIDVGGVSTRPGSSEPLQDEELARVVGVVKAIRSDSELDDVLVSVDTYRAEVARQTLSAGADIINDVSMGLYDEELFDVVAEFGCGYIMSHTRGTPATMSDLTQYGPADDGIVEYNLDKNWHVMRRLESSAQNLINGVCRELAAQYRVAISRGVRKWQVMVDPGIGFAKKGHQNVALLRHARRIKSYALMNLVTGEYTSFCGMAMLVGASRKRFLGEISGESEASQRLVPSTAAVVASVEQGADLVRVHDVSELRQAAAVADAIYRALS